MGPTREWVALKREGGIVEDGCHIYECCVGWCWGSLNASHANVVGRETRSVYKLTGRLPHRRDGIDKAKVKLNTN